MYVIVINRRQGLYWFYKSEAERLLNQYRPTAPVNKYFLDHAVTQLEGTERCILLWQYICIARYPRATKTRLLVSVRDLPSLGNCMRFLPSLGYCMRIWPS